VLQRGGNNQPGLWHHRMTSMVVSVVASWLLRLLLFCGCGWLSRLRRRFPRLLVISRSCVVVVAIVVSCHCGWLLRLVVVSHGCVIVSRFAWLFPAIASWLLQWLCLAVVVGCHGWLLFPAVASSFPTVVSSLQLLHLAIVVGCHGCHHCHGCFCGCCTHCCLLSWLMILVVAVVSVVRWLFPLPLLVFSFVWQIVFAVVKVAASVMHCASEFLQLFAEMDGCNSDVRIIIFSVRFKHEI